MSAVAVILVIAAALAPAASGADEETVQIGWLSQTVKRTFAALLPRPAAAG